MRSELFLKTSNWSREAVSVSKQCASDTNPNTMKMLATCFSKLIEMSTKRVIRSRAAFTSNFSYLHSKIRSCLSLKGRSVSHMSSLREFLLPMTDWQRKSLKREKYLSLKSLPLPS